MRRYRSVRRGGGLRLPELSVPVHDQLCISGAVHARQLSGAFRLPGWFVSDAPESHGIVFVLRKQWLAVVGCRGSLQMFYKPYTLNSKTLNPKP